jgi:hypothetical protein
MSIKVKVSLESDPTELDNLAEIVNFSGLTSTGEKFLHDLVTDEWYVFDSSVTSFVKMDTTLADLQNSNQNYNISLFKNTVNGFMERTVSLYGYNSIHDVISYYNSGITAWRNEAIAFNTWRDNTIDLMYDNIYSFTADGITLPSLTAGGFTGQTGYFDVALGSPSRPLLFS